MRYLSSMTISLVAPAVITQELATPKPLIYLAGPYTHPDPVENTHRAIKAGMGLWETGKVAVIIPHLSLAAHLVAPRDLDYWYAFDIDQLAHCQALYQLDGPSRGVEREVAYAREHRIPVFGENERDQLLTWADAWSPAR
jgi:hypothetical protein